MRVHVRCQEGEAKFWLEPEVEVAQSHGLSPLQISGTLQCVKERRDEIEDAWREHFKS
jgi:hypothetical protein